MQTVAAESGTQCSLVGGSGGMTKEPGADGSWDPVGCWLSWDRAGEGDRTGMGAPKAP